MFKRKKPLSLLQIAQQFCWPSMGWKRFFVYIKYRLMRVADSTHKIALGLAIGMAISFTPLLGTHFLQAGIIALILRANIFSAMIGTFVGNPWTFPFFWWAGFSFGAFLFSLLGLDGHHPLPAHIDFNILWDMIRHKPMTVFLPWMLGGYILCALCLPTSYFVFYYLVETAKKARDKAKMKRFEKITSEITGQKK